MLTLLGGYNAIEEVGRFDVVMFGTNIYGEMNGGLQKEIAEKYPYVREENLKQPYGDMRRLGSRLTIHRGDDPIFTLLYMCGKGKGGRVNGFHREAYIHALQTANNEFKGERVLSPIIGSTNWDGKQDRMEMLSLMEEHTPDLNLFIFETFKNKQ